MPTPRGYTLGPGKVTFGGTTDTLDVSCQATGVMLSPKVEESDAVPTVGGCELPGTRRYVWRLSGKFLTDLDAAGIGAYCETHAGEQVPFTFAPNTETAPDAEATGTVILDPLPYGGEKPTEWLESEFEFAVVGQPSFAWQDSAPAGP